MERFKVITEDKDARRHALWLALVMLCFAVLSQACAAYTAYSYKASLIGHDYAVAGYLSRNAGEKTSKNAVENNVNADINTAGTNAGPDTGANAGPNAGIIDETKIAKAFTAVKTESDAEAGRKLLAVSGYTESTATALIPEAADFYLKCASAAFLLSAAFSAAVFAVFYGYLCRHDARLVNAAEKLGRFTDGDTSVRLEDVDGDGLSRLLSVVNVLATSLTAHIEKEKLGREFLKDTVSDISHQLKTPLAALRMYNEIIADEKTGNETVDSFASKSQRELDRMENLIQNLLKLAKLDAGAVVLDRNVRELKAFLEDVADGFVTRARAEKKELILKCGSGTVLSFDGIWLGEAVGNIVKNALDHTKEGGRIEITCSESAVAVEIAVKDDGAGIHPEDIHHIFKRFYRSRFSSDTRGVGIGLSITKAVVEKHGGIIAVLSEPGRGAEFRMIFPKILNL